MIFKEVLNNLSFPRRRESTLLIFLETRPRLRERQVLRGCDKNDVIQVFPGEQGVIFKIHV